MKTLHVRLRKGINTITLQQNSFETSPTLRVTRCVVAWSIKNVRSGVNDAITVGGVDKTIPEGYYSFSDLKTELAKHNVTIDKTRANHIKVMSTADVQLKQLGESLLGFTSQQSTLAKDTTHESAFSASLTNKIKDIHVYCDLVDSSKNYSYLLSNTSLYYSSTHLLMIPIDTTQSLNGNFTEYTIDQSLPCRANYNFQHVDFIVESGGHQLDYEIFLSLDFQ